MIPIACHGRAGNRPAFIADCLPLRAEEYKPENTVWVSDAFFRTSWRSR